MSQRLTKGILEVLSSCFYEHEAGGFLGLRETDPKDATVFTDENIEKTQAWLASRTVQYLPKSRD